MSDLQDDQSFGHTNSVIDSDAEQNNKEPDEKTQPHSIIDRNNKNTIKLYNDLHIEDTPINIDTESEQRLHAFLCKIRDVGSKPNTECENNKPDDIDMDGLVKRAEGAKMNIFSHLLNRQLIDVYVEVTPHIMTPTIDFNYCLIGLDNQFQIQRQIV